MKPIVADAELVACCGLYCAACPAYRRDRCPGCQKNEKATWCKVRSCCIENQYSSCAECDSVSDAAECRKFNNIVAKLFGFVFRSDRRACIVQIKENGLEEHAYRMADAETHTIRR